ncbi:MAG: hypothetical protein ABGW69_02475 [Nanoarchaeota archaeon]
MKNSLKLWKAFFIWNKSKINFFINYKEKFVDYLNGESFFNEKMEEGVNYHFLISRFFREKIPIEELDKLEDKILRSVILKIIQLKQEKDLTLIAVEKTLRIELDIEEISLKEEITKYLKESFKRESLIINGKLDFLFFDKEERPVILELKLKNFIEDNFYAWLIWKVIKREPILITLSIKGNNFIERQFKREELEKIDNFYKEKIKEAIEFIYCNKEKIK